MFLYIYTAKKGIGMFNFIQNFIYWVLSLQEKILSKKLKRSFKQSYSHSTTKTVFSKGNSLKLTTLTEKNKEKLKNEVEIVLKNNGNDPAKLLEFVEKNGTPVYKIPFANKFLQLINYEEGLIGELKGAKAIYLSLVTSVLSGKGLKIKLTTEPMFVIRNLQIDQYCMIQQFHKWYAMKLNLPGFDAESQENFQKFLDKADDDEIKSLSVDEILGLKEAIARDVEAINFVVSLAKATSGSQSALKKMSTGGASV